MTPLIVLVVLIIIAAVVVRVLTTEPSGGSRDERVPRTPYKYTKKQFFLTRAENECFQALQFAVGNKYLIIPQAHLSHFIDNKVVGQPWKYAFYHISQKSVDFLLCDRKYINPILAIELDDRSHERPDRVERDTEVERILKEAQMPLLRLKNHGSFNTAELTEQINAVISSSNLTEAVG